MASHGLPHVAKNLDTDKERKLIEEYRKLVDAVTLKVKVRQYDEETLNLIASLLKKNPEYYTIWNHRRLVLRALVEAAAKGTTQPNASAELIKNDLNFLVPLLKEFPKCYWIWNYRQWLLTLSGEVLPNEQTLKLWQQELGLVSMMLGRDARNFHGWSYRRQVIHQLESLMGGSDHADSTSSSLVEQEFHYTTQKIRDALANFSALHYRSKLIPRLLDERRADGQARRQMLEAELDLMQDALIDPFNQSAWFYHQFLMDAINTRTSFVTDLTDEEIARYNRQEIERIVEILEEGEDGCKWVYQALVEYTQLYQVSGGSAATMQSDVARWKAELLRLDPFRAGRWRETL